MDKDKMQTATTFAVTIALLLFAFLLVDRAIELAMVTERVSPETLAAGLIALANTIVVAAVARWLQAGAAQSAERAADRVVAAVSSNGLPPPTPQPPTSPQGPPPTLEDYSG